jgi:hypothetical protein
MPGPSRQSFPYACLRACGFPGTRPPRACYRLSNRHVASVPIPLPNVPAAAALAPDTLKQWA